MARFEPLRPRDLSNVPGEVLPGEVLTLSLLPGAVVPMTEAEVAWIAGAGNCPCSCDIAGACEPGSGNSRDCTVRTNVNHAWAVAWAYISRGAVRFVVMPSTLPGMGL